MRISPFPGGALATSPLGMLKTSHNSTTFDSVARETFTEHRYLPITLGSLPSYNRMTNVTKHMAVRGPPPPSGVRFIAGDLSSVVKETCKVP